MLPSGIEDTQGPEGSSIGRCLGTPLLLLGLWIDSRIHSSSECRTLAFTFGDLVPDLVRERQVMSQGLGSTMAGHPLQVFASVTPPPGPGLRDVRSLCFSFRVCAGKSLRLMRGRQSGFSRSLGSGFHRTHDFVVLRIGSSCVLGK